MNQQEFVIYAQQEMQKFSQVAYNVQVFFVQPGTVLPIPCYLPEHAAGYFLIHETILLDATAPLDTQMAVFYHELGHLQFRRKNPPPVNERDNELFAQHYCMSRLATERRIELLRQQMNYVQQLAVTKQANISESQKEAAAALLRHSDWTDWVTITVPGQP